MKIKSIKKVRPERVYAVKTTTNTFIADGLAHHNCVNCNMYQSGNLSVYAVKLEQKYGYGILQEFEAIRQEEDLIRRNEAPKKPITREMLLEMIEFYKLCLGELLKEDV